MRAALLALLVVVPSVLAGSPVEESRTYVAPTHPTSARFTSCAVPEPLALNGACFRLVPGEHARVAVSVADVTGLPILIHVFMQSPTIQVGADIYTCAPNATLDIPADAVVLRVWFPVDDGVEAPPYCPLLHGEALLGTVTARFV